MLSSWFRTFLCPVFRSAAVIARIEAWSSVLLRWSCLYVWLVLLLVVGCILRGAVLLMLRILLMIAIVVLVVRRLELLRPLSGHGKSIERTGGDRAWSRLES